MLTVQELYDFLEDLVETDPNAEILIRGDRQDPFWYAVDIVDTYEGDPREPNEEGASDVVVLQMGKQECYI